MASFLPSCRCPDGRLQGFRGPAPRPVFPQARQPLVRFGATLSVLRPQAPPSPRVLGRPKPTPVGASLELRCPSAFQDPTALFCTPFGASAARCPAPRKSRPRGLATLSAASAIGALGASFSPRRSWASPFRALLLHGDRKNLSASLFRPCAFARNLLGFEPALRRLGPTVKAVPLLATRWIRSGRGPCSLGPSGLSGSPSAWRTQRASLPPDNPHGLGSPRPSRNGLARPSGRSRQTARHFPLRDAGLSGLSAVRLSRPLRRSGLPRTIFSSRDAPTPCEARALSLCGRPSLS